MDYLLTFIIFDNPVLIILCNLSFTHPKYELYLKEQTFTYLKQ